MNSNVFFVLNVFLFWFKIYLVKEFKFYIVDMLFFIKEVGEEILRLNEFLRDVGI